MIRADSLLISRAHEKTLECRQHIEGFIQRHPDFATTLAPWRRDSAAPAIVRRMIDASRTAGVGPMAAVAGAIAESVGRELLEFSEQVVVENGGDIFMKTDHPAVAGVFAGGSPLNMKVGIRVPNPARGIAVCTSSATVGHSLSAGRADAVCVVSRSCALADAAATAIGNRVRRPGDIQPVIDASRHIPGLMGILVIVGKEMGAWGRIELVPVNRKKG
jgi:ApbE superfamily uncharacterized protein (UPF0280 family)